MHTKIVASGRRTGMIGKPFEPDRLVALVNDPGKSPVIRNNPDLVQEILSRFASETDPRKIRQLAWIVLQELPADACLQDRLQALGKLLEVSGLPERRRHLYTYGQLDGHTHSIRSDGYSTVSALLYRALTMGMKGIALTDHDLAPQPRESSEALMAGAVIQHYLEKTGTPESFHYIPGIEIETFVNDVRVHVLLYIPRFFSDYDRIRSHPAWLEYEQHSRRIWTSENYQTLSLMEQVNLLIEADFPQVLRLEQEELDYLKRSHYYLSLVTDALYFKNREFFEEFLKNKPVRGSKGVWYYFLPDQLKIRFKEERRQASNFSFGSIVRLAKAIGGRLAIAHPNEIFDEEKKQNRKDTFKAVIYELADLVQRGELSCFGLPLVSRKLTDPGLRQELYVILSALNTQYPGICRSSIFNVYESDSHWPFGDPPGIRMSPQDIDSLLIPINTDQDAFYGI